MNNTVKDFKWALENNLTVVYAEDLLDQMLDATQPPVNIDGYNYDLSTALKRVDPVAYRQEVLNYTDSLITEGQVYELEDGTLIMENPDDFS